MPVELSNQCENGEGHRGTLYIYAKPQEPLGLRKKGALMTYAIRGTIALMMVLMLVVPMVSAQHRGHQGMMMPRVPAEHIDEARALSSPLPQTSEIVEQGKAIYEGKGTCFNCHGKTGGGDGPGGVNLNPAPRNFRHHGMWRHRTEGEIFWVIKNGSPGTGMIPFGGLLTDEEIWTVMQYERSFAKGHGGVGMGRHRGMGPMGHGKKKGRGGRHGMKKSGEHDEEIGEERCCEK